MFVPMVLQRIAFVGRVAAAVALLLVVAACSRTPDPAVATKSPAAAPHEDAGINWFKGDVDAAFAAARADDKPLFLYWGAAWCPPCNQVKATIFNRQDFIERARGFVPVYVDGDSPSAQRIGTRFAVSGYPTMILFTPDGREITRLPGEVDADQYMRVLTLGMNRARPVKDTLAAALAPTTGNSEAALTPDDWRMLAWYSWITDDGTLIPKSELAPTLARLAAACPAAERGTAVRLKLQALAAAAAAPGAVPKPDAEAARFAGELVTDRDLVRENFDLVTYRADEIAAYTTTPRTPERAQLVARWNTALDGLVADTSLSTADRLTALSAKVDLAKLDAGKAPLPSALQDTVRYAASRADRETGDVYARQAVVSTAADLLADAGLLDASDAMLKAELSRSHSPYYYMLGLAANAKKRGDHAEALQWHQSAWNAAVGSATRLQWGASYISALVDLAPANAAAIETAVAQVLGELDVDTDAGAFHDRNRRALERIAKKLAAWNRDGAHDDSMRRLDASIGATCAKVAASADRDTCDTVLRAPRPAAS
jgi:thiol-disulfide isomerase/thioredoxin